MHVNGTLRHILVSMSARWSHAQNIPHPARAPPRVIAVNTTSMLNCVKISERSWIARHTSLRLAVTPRVGASTTTPRWSASARVKYFRVASSTKRTAASAQGGAILTLIQTFALTMVLSPHARYSELRSVISVCVIHTGGRLTFHRRSANRAMNANGISNTLRAIHDVRGLS